MKVIDIKDLKDTEYDIPIISRDIMEIRGVVKALYNLECSEELINFVNSINNQGIEYIDCKSMSYIYNNQRFAMHEMGTAEQLFIISYFAVKTNKKICILHAYRHVREDVLKIYIDWLKENDKLDCVTLVTVNYIDSAVLKEVI